MNQFEKDILTTQEYAPEVINNQELYAPHGIEEYYQKSIVSLHAQIAKLEEYVKAKENEPALAAEIATLMTTRPANGLTLMEKMNQLQNYERVIKYFEDKNIPDELLQTTKDSIEELKARITEFSQVLKVAQEHPGLN